MNKEDVRQKMLDIVGDIYNAKFVEHGLNGYTKFDGHTLDEAKYTINRAFDDITIDHPKVKLPREVGEELDEYKRGFEHDIDVLDLLDDVNSLSELPKTNKWIYDSDGDRSDNANRIIDAYRYGWEAEPEELFYVKVPENWGTGLTFTWVTMKYGEFNLINKEDAQTFTRAQIKEYHLDSDIFTLVPVEEEK